MIPWLSDIPERFPPVGLALTEPNGLLAAGGDLSPRRLMAAYRQGIFPWYAPGDPILWWSPDPRMVLFPDQFHISHSLHKTLRRGTYRVRLDRSFAQVLTACATTPRNGQQGTWIVPEMQAAYRHLHELGLAHSVEAWEGDTLVGGLYGVALGRVFYGESMFSHRTDASKVAAAYLARFLERRGFRLIDCQMHTPHLASLGARLIPRQEFVALLESHTGDGPPAGLWTGAEEDFDWKEPHVPA